MNKLGALAPKLGRPIKKKKRSNCRKTVFLKCQECGKYYEVPYYDKNKRKYCSRTCGSRAFNRTRKIYTLKTVNCLCCGDEFTFKSYPTKKDQRFCCTDCANKFNRAREYEERRAKLMEEIERDYNELMCNV